MSSTGSAQDDLQIGDVLTDPVGDGKNYTWDGEAWRSSGTVIIAGSKTTGVSANGTQITVYDPAHTAFMNSTFISVGGIATVSSTAFSAYPNVNQTGIANETWTKVLFQSTLFNNSSLYNTGTSRWTPTVGRCQISAGLYYTAGLFIGTPIFIGINKNGALFKHTVGACVSSGQAGATITIMDACNGTDYYEVFTHIFTGSTATLDSASGGTFFMGTPI